MSSKKTSDGLKKDNFAETQSGINAENHPGAAVVNKALTAAKENGTYYMADKRGRPTTFKTGQPNPKKLTLIEELADRLGIENNNKIFANIVEAAANKDMQAMIFIMERLYPKGKAPRHINSSIRDLITLADIDAAQTQIIREAAAGDIDLDDADVLFSMTVKKSDFQVRQTAEQMKLLIEELKEAKGVK